MLTMNNLQTIIPPVESAAAKIIREEFKRGNHKRGDETFHLDWETHLSMEWDAEEMRKAILVNPLSEEKSAPEQQDLELKIDTLLQQYTDEERKEVTPALLLQVLNETRCVIQLIQTLTSSQSASSSQNASPPQETGLFCSGYRVM
jgi:hypothetical protein